MAWRGAGGPYSAIQPGSAGGGGLRYSRLGTGAYRAIQPGQGGGGGAVQSAGAPVAGAGGCSGPGPGALIGLR